MVNKDNPRKLNVKLILIIIALICIFIIPFSIAGLKGKSIEFIKNDISFSYGCSYYRLHYTDDLTTFANDIKTLNIDSVKENIGTFKNLRIEWKIKETYQVSVNDYGICEGNIPCSKVIDETHCEITEEMFEDYSYTKECKSIDKDICYYDYSCVTGSHSEDRYREVYKPIWKTKVNKAVLKDSKYLTNKIKLDKDKAFDYITKNDYLDFRICGDIEREGTSKGWEVSLDHIPEFKNIKYSEFTWWNSSWDKCKNITITNVGTTTLTDFPAYINVTYDSDMLANYSDLRFVNDSCNNGGSELDYEIENYTSTKADIWVRIDSLPTTDKIISMYYDNSGASSGENPTGVWDDNFVMVQHMYDNSTTSIEDSTSNDNDGTKKGANEPNQTTDGKIDSAQDSDGVDDYINTGYDPTWTSTQSYTFTAWFKTSSTAINQIIAGTIAEKGPSDPHTFFAGVGVTGGGGTANKLGFNFRDDNNNAAGIIESSSDVNDGNWHFVTSVRDVPSDKYYLYLDGSLVNSNTDTTTEGFDFSNYPIYISSFNIRGTSNWFFNGTIDEVRISNTTRTADWINQSYQLVQNQGTYVVFGSEEARVDITPPVLSSINCTSNPDGDTTEPYNTSADLTPSFTFDTDETATCGISDTNSSFINGASGTSHNLQLDYDKRLNFETDYVYINCTDAFDNSAYDEWEVFIAPFPFIIDGTIILSEGTAVFRQCS